MANMSVEKKKTKIYKKLEKIVGKSVCNLWSDYAQTYP